MAQGSGWPRLLGDFLYSMREDINEIQRRLENHSDQRDGLEKEK
jgi:hypothetical protein